MATAAFTFAERLPVNGLYTFGQPRVAILPSVHMRQPIRRLHVPLRQRQRHRYPRAAARRAAYPLPEFYGTAASFAFSMPRACSRRTNIGGTHSCSAPMWLRKHGRLLTEPVADPALIEGYATNLEKYVADLAAGTQKPI